MNSKKDLEKQASIAAEEYLRCSVLLRNVIGKKLGLNIADTECLGLLFNKGISSPTELASYTGLTTGSTTAMLDRLEKANLIKRTANPKDRRGVLIEINKKLAETVEPIFSGAQKVQNELLADYSDKELETLARFLTTITENLKEYTAVVDREFGCISPLTNN